MDEPKKPTAFTMSLSELEQKALDIVGAREVFAGLDLDRRRLIKFCILDAAKAIAREDLATKADVQRVANEVAAMASILGNSVIRSDTGMKKPGPKANAKPTEEEKLEIVTGLCEAMSGTVRNGTCYYEKHEKTASGSAVSYQVGVPLAHLSQKDVDNQYFPSKEEFLEAREKNGTMI